MNEQLEQRLIKFLDFVEPLFHPKEAHALGFQSGSTRTPVYIGESSGSPWYTLDGEVQVPIKNDALVGYLVGISIRSKESTKYGPSTKLTLGIRADKNYTVTSGIDTTFTKGLIAALATGRFTTKTRIRLTARVGDTNKVILGSIFNDETGEMVIGESLKDGDDFHQIAQEGAAACGLTFKDSTIAADAPQPRSTRIS